jgi:hypothetical protein
MELEYHRLPSRRLIALRTENGAEVRTLLRISYSFCVFLFGPLVSTSKYNNYPSEPVLASKKGTGAVIGPAVLSSPSLAVTSAALRLRAL